jgi:hypothetical protein
MPCNIPAHIFDIDEATAERLALYNIRRRRLRRLLAAIAAFVGAATLLGAV